MLSPARVVDDVTFAERRARAVIVDRETLGGLVEEPRRSVVVGVAVQPGTPGGTVPVRPRRLDDQPRHVEFGSPVDVDGINLV